MKGKAEYAGRRKQSHRGWMWNRVIEGLPRHTPPAKARGLAMLGPDPLRDIHAATSKGLDVSRLAAVDVSQKAVTAARRAGVACVAADVFDVVQWWNDQPLDFLILDTCSSFLAGERLLRSALLSRAVSYGTVVYVNMQRGRESATARDSIDSLHRFMPMREFPKHRGELLMLKLLEIYLRNEHEFYDECAESLPRCLQEEMLESVGPIGRTMAPVYDSYRSDSARHLMMDSVVFRWPFSRPARPLSQEPPTPLKRKLAALKAVVNRRVGPDQHLLRRAKRMLLAHKEGSYETPHYFEPVGNLSAHFD